MMVIICSSCWGRWCWLCVPGCWQCWPAGPGACPSLGGREHCPLWRRPQQGELITFFCSSLFLFVRWPSSESLLAAAVSHFRWTSLSKKKWTIQGMYVYYIVNTLYHHLSFRNSRHMNVWFIPYTIYQTNPSSCPHTPRARFSERFFKAASVKSQILIQNYHLDLPRIIRDYPELCNCPGLSKIV